MNFNVFDLPTPFYTFALVVLRQQGKKQVNKLCIFLLSFLFLKVYNLCKIYIYIRFDIYIILGGSFLFFFSSFENIKCITCEKYIFDLIYIIFLETRGGSPPFFFSSFENIKCITCVKYIYIFDLIYIYYSWGHFVVTWWRVPRSFTNFLKTFHAWSFVISN